MNTDTSKIYAQLTSQEKAGILYREIMKPEPNENEVIRIASTVPTLQYSAKDYKFTDQVQAYDNVASYWLIGWFETLSNFHIMNAGFMAYGLSNVERDKNTALERLASAKIYGGNLCAFDMALEMLDLMVIRDSYMPDTVLGRGYCRICQIEPDEELVSAYAEKLARMMSEVIHD